MATLVGGYLRINSGILAKTGMRSAKNRVRRPFQTSGLEFGAEVTTPQVFEAQRRLGILRREDPCPSSFGTRSIHARSKAAAASGTATRRLKQPRGTQRYQPTQREDEARLTQTIISIA
jgi:hypothetical protein